MCDSTQGSLCPSPMKIHHKVSAYSDTFCKNLNQRSLTPRWPLTPHLLRSHVWLYPRSIVSKSHKNTSKYVDTVTLLAKTWTKSHWLLDNLWPHICWGHMCGSTQGSLCPSPMGIHQCMWIHWDQFCKLPHTYQSKSHHSFNALYARAKRFAEQAGPIHSQILVNTHDWTTQQQRWLLGCILTNHTAVPETLAWRTTRCTR